MYKFHYVTQPTSNSCGLACIMMFSDITFEQAQKLTGKKGGTWYKDMMKAFIALNIQCSNKPVRIKNDKALPPVCIIKIHWTDINRNHVVVYNKGVVYDPAHPQIIKISDYNALNGRLISYLEIYE